MLDLKPRLGDPSVRELLSLSIGAPTSAKIDRVCHQYFSADSWVLRGYQSDEGVVGCIGIEIHAPREAVIHHVSVAPSVRKRDIGRMMVEQICAEFSLMRLTAKTDKDAVGFYRSCGFEVESLGELYPSVERFRCELHLD